jgi:hypothetical protein
MIDKISGLDQGVPLCLTVTFVVCIDYGMLDYWVVAMYAKVPFEELF